MCPRHVAKFFDGELQAETVHHTAQILGNRHPTERMKLRSYHLLQRAALSSLRSACCCEHLTKPHTRPHLHVDVAFAVLIKETPSSPEALLPEMLQVEYAREMVCLLYLACNTCVGSVAARRGPIASMKPSHAMREGTAALHPTSRALLRSLQSLF